MFAPLLLGTLFAARVTADPRDLVVITKLVLLPLSVAMVAAVSSGSAQLWMVFPFILSYGFGGMVNMTAQRELFLRFAGPLRATRVLNTEMAGIASAMMLGPLLGGLTIQQFGIGAAFAMPTVLLAVSIPLLWLSTRHIPQAAPNPDEAPLIPAASDWRTLLRVRALVVVLVVTVICNLCYFAFMPLVPVIAEFLDAGPGMAGVIGATPGVVQLAVAALLIVRPAGNPMAAYTIGVAICLCCLAVLSYLPSLTGALLVLAVAGVGQALFATTQATLPLVVVPPHSRVVALGMLTTTIGVGLPTGMVALGVMSSLFGAHLAMLVSAVVGLVALALTAWSNRTVMTGSGGAVGAGGEGDSITAQPKLG